MWQLSPPYVCSACGLGRHCILINPARCPAGLQPAHAQTVQQDAMSVGRSGGLPQQKQIPRVSRFGRAPLRPAGESRWVAQCKFRGLCTNRPPQRAVKHPAMWCRTPLRFAPTIPTLHRAAREHVGRTRVHGAKARGAPAVVRTACMAMHWPPTQRASMVPQEGGPCWLFDDGLQRLGARELPD